MTRTRRLIGVLTLLVLAAIAFDVTGVGLPIAHLGASAQTPALPGVQAVSADMLLRVGAGAPPGGELAFMAVEPAGNLVVSDSKRRTLMRFDPTGHLLSQWGPTLGATELGEPAGVAVSGSSYYVLDRGTPRIFRLDSGGNVQSSIDLAALSTYGLNGLAVDAGGNIYAADTGRNRVLVFSPSGQLEKQIGHAGDDLGGFTQPMMLAFAPDGSFVVADWENSRIERFDASLQATDAWPTGFHAFGVAVDPLGRVYAPDSEHHRVEAYTPEGSSLGDIGSVGPSIDVVPKQVALPASGEPALYVLGSDGIQRLDLENTPPPPQGTAALDSDLVGMIVFALLIGLVVLAMISRRLRRRGALSVAAPLDGPVRLGTEDGAQRQQQQSGADEDLLIAHQTKRE